MRICVYDNGATPETKYTAIPKKPGKKNLLACGSGATQKAAVKDLLKQMR